MKLQIIMLPGAKVVEYLKKAYAAQIEKANNERTSKELNMFEKEVETKELEYKRNAAFAAIKE